MLKLTTHKTVAALVIVAACLAIPEASRAATALKLSGAIAGTVSNNLGVPQMGATVLLFTRVDRPYGKVVTDEHGGFQFAGLTPDSYSVRVMLTTFVPALRRNILVQPGMRSVLNVNLSSLFSTIQISYPTIENPTVMTDDWKWMLRSASVTRPVLRFVDTQQVSGPAPARAALFSDTRGILQVSAGEGPLGSGVAMEADLGTAFALATSLYGSGSIQVSGNMGYGSQTGTPAAAFRTSYSRNMAGGTPEISLTMRQLMLPGRFSAAMTGNESALPMVRTVSAGFSDRTQLSENITVQYGFTLDSVAFVDRLNYMSPYARLSYSMGENGEIDFAYTSGNARPDLGAAQSQDSDLQGGLNSLSMFPRVALRDGRSTVQRGQEYEASYSLKHGSRTYRVSAYREAVTNAALSMVAPAGMFSAGDVLPDLFSATSTFNVGNFESAGYSAAMTQNMGDHLNATVIYGSTGGLTARDGELTTNSADELRSMIRSGRRHTATGRLSAILPKAGTHMIASYEWTADRRFAMPGNLYSTQDVRPQPGLNVYIRQPLPGPSVLRGRMEATADLRNLLAEGYLPIGTAGGQQVLLVETPRSFRGGVAFIF